jgi:hypothetical protein
MVGAVGAANEGLCLPIRGGAVPALPGPHCRCRCAWHLELLESGGVFSLIETRASHDEHV